MLFQLGKLVLLLTSIHALSLSYRMKAGEQKACFFVPVTDTAALIQLYYSVVNKANENAKGLVNMVVTGPHNQQLHTITAQSHAEISLKPVEIGDHSICFTHLGNPTDKTLDLDVALTNSDGTPFISFKPTEVDANGSPLQPNNDASTQELENSVNRVTKDLTEISHTLKYLKNREKRNLYTVENNARAIWWFSFFETLLIVGMSLCQVAILRHFFGRSGRPRV